MVSRGSFTEVLDQFVSTPLEEYERAILAWRDEGWRAEMLEFALRAPAYGAFLAAEGVDPAEILASGEYGRLPEMTKANYVRRFPLEQRCLDGIIGQGDIMSVSSGTSGTSVMWPRSLADEARSSFAFEAILKRSLKGGERSTLALICFPLGIWVGGIHTINSVRMLALKGYRLTCLAPGTNLEEIRRCLVEVAPHFDQTVMFGYPPFLRDVVSEMVPSAADPEKVRIRLVLAGEAVSESWRDATAAKLLHDDPESDCIGMYGTADAGVIAFETALTIRVRRMVAQKTGLADKLWGRPDTPALFQYHPDRVHLEEGSQSIVMWLRNTHPLVRYNIGDVGSAASSRKFLGQAGLEPEDSLPFVHQYGRQDSTVSFFGGNIFPEHVASYVDRVEHQTFLTGRFAVLVCHTASENRPLSVVVEARKGMEVPGAYREDFADALMEHLVTVNSEYANYVPKKYQRPDLTVADFQDPRYFARGKKQKYVQEA